MMEYAIRTEGITKIYRSKEEKRLLQRKKRKEVHALKGIDLRVRKGEMFGLLGPNGAGKTTFIKILTTLLLPTSGNAWVNGYDVLKEERMVRGSIGCMLMGERGLYWKLTGRENLEYFGALYYVPKKQRRERIEYLIELLDLGDFIDRTVETYSSGQKMMVSFAKALINDAETLFLDEPTIAMDVHAARKLRKVVKELNREGKTIIYTTHLMHEADELCDRIAIIDKGEIKATGTPEELKASIKHEGVIRIEGIIPQKAIDMLSSLDSVEKLAVEEKGGKEHLRIITGNSRSALPKIIKALMDNGATLEYISPEEATLEDVFVKLTGRALSEDTKEVADEPESAKSR